ncbi:unnamed protein product [Pipistrellus nathusii]|uniref:Uncharacterized protein n=1 Tax=Pipistrellus nathusii TaxID=59473 RepID=A0ABN9Z8E0_PIPNA
MVQGKPMPTGAVSVLRTFTPEVSSGQLLPGSSHCGVGVGGPGLRGAPCREGRWGGPAGRRSLRGGEEGEEHSRGCSSAGGRAPPGRAAGARRKRNWARES